MFHYPESRLLHVNIVQTTCAHSTKYIYGKGAMVYVDEHVHGTFRTSGTVPRDFTSKQASLAAEALSAW